MQRLAYRFRRALHPRTRLNMVMRVRHSGFWRDPQAYEAEGMEEELTRDWSI
jgi:hypothetical protein